MPIPWVYKCIQPPPEIPLVNKKKICRTTSILTQILQSSGHVVHSHSFVENHRSK